MSNPPVDNRLSRYLTRVVPLLFPILLQTAFAATVNVGYQKQLLVDDYAVSTMSGVNRVLGKVIKMNNSQPVLTADQPWENLPAWFYGSVLNDGQKFKMWYRVGDTLMAYAESVDGLKWVKPIQGLVSYQGNNQNNLFSLSVGTSFSAFFDAHETDPAHQYKAAFAAGKSAGLMYSQDGVHWTAYNNGQAVTFPASDSYNQLLWDTATQQYRLVVRHNFGTNASEIRGTRVMSNPDVKANPTNWTTLGTFAFPDTLRKQIYSLTDWTYEGVHFALVMLYEYPGDLSEGGRDLFTRHERDVLNYYIATSRDGFNWDFSWVQAGAPIIPRGPDGSFDKDWVFPASSIVTYQDKHWLYYVGAKERHDVISLLSSDVPGIGLATLRLDGFVGLQAAQTPGYVVTKPFVVPGGKLDLNIDASTGSLAVEVLDQNGNPIPGYTQSDSIVPNGVDSLRLRPSWASHADLTALIGTQVQLKFYLTNATLYSFKFPDPLANQPPIVTITSPASGLIVPTGTPVTIVANASDDVAVSKVEFFQDFTKLGESSTGPATYSWQNAPEGTFVVTARATDSGGLFTNSTPVYVTFDTRPVIASVFAGAYSNIVNLVFSKPVQKLSAETISNYAINNGVSITAATLAADGKSVTLTTSTMNFGTAYALTVNNVVDLLGIAIVPNSTASFTLVQAILQGLSLWLRADAGVVLNGSTVSQWTDQSFSAANAVQPIDANQPALVSGVIRGNPVLRFSGASKFLTFSLNMNGTTGMTMILVNANGADLDGTWNGTTNAPLFWNETTSWSSIHLSPFQRYVKYRFGTTQGGNLPSYTRPTSIGSAFTLTTAVKSGATETLYVNGQQVLTQTGKLPTIAGVQTSGSIGRGYDNNTYYTGDIAEILIYNRTLSDSERQLVEQYLLGKYFGVAQSGPVISGVNTSPVTVSGGTINWTTDIPADSQVEYGETATYGQTSALINTSTTSHSVVLGGLSAATTYHYRVKSRDASNNSVTSGDLTFTTLPLPPSGLAATPGNGQVALSWNAAGSAPSYNVKQATVSGGPYTNIASGVAAPNYVSTGLTNGVTYFYVVAAVNNGGEGAISSQVSAQPLAPPPSPTGLTATPGNAQVTLNWAASATSTGYNVKRSTTNGGPYTNVVTNLSGASYVNTGLSNGITYFYVVSATNGGGEGANSAQVSGQPFGPPAAPNGLTATAGNAQASLLWTVTANASGYNVKRSTSSGGPYSTVGSNVSTTSYVNAGLNNGTIYFYVVSALNSSGEGVNSGQVSVQPVSLPGAPTNLTATAGSGQVALSWTASPTATGYNIKQSISSGGPYTTIATNVLTVSYVNVGLVGGVTYYYVVSAVNSGGEGPNSSQASAQAIALPTGPGSVPAQGLQMWLRADAGVVLNGPTVSQWTDQSSSGANAVQSVGANQPVLVPGVIRGNPVLRFSGASKFLTFSLNTNGTTGMTMILVNANGADLDGTWNGTTNAPLFWNETSSWSSIHLSPFQRYVKYRFGTTQGGNLPSYTRPASIGSTFTLTTAVKNGATETLYVNGQQVLTQNGKLPTIAGVQTTGSIGRGYDNNTYYTGDIAEILVYNRTLSDSERQLVEQYLVNKYFVLGPVISGVNASPVTVSGGTINWTTDIPGDSQVDYGETGTYGQASALINTLTTSHSIVLSGLSAATTYHYRVRSRDASNNLVTSGDFTFTTVPLPPSGLAATPGNGQVALSWAAAGGATGYNIKQATVSGGPYTTIASNVVAVNLLKTGLANGTTYFYVISAVNGGGEGANSNEISVQPIPPPLPPAGVTATAGNGQVTITWTPSLGASSYNIKRATVTGGPYVVVAPNVLTIGYVDAGLSNGTTYFYVVSALNSSGEGADSSQATGQPVPPPVPPADVTAVAGNAQVTINWASSVGANSYNVKRAPVGGGPYTIIAANLLTISYVDTGLINGTIYFYVISAINGSGEGANSAQVGSQPLAPPVAPTGVSSSAGNAQVSLSWNVSSTATSYNLKRSTVSGGPYSTVAPNVATTSYVDSGVTNGTTYFYVVSAVNGSGEGPNSAQVNGHPLAPPSAPAGLTASAGNGQVSLSWGASSTATGYNVKRSTVSGGSYTTVAPNVAATSYVDDGVTNGTAYFYVVSAVNGSGEGPNSSQVSGLPLAPPPAPSGLTATASNAQVSLGWSASSTAATYNVKRSTVDAGSYITIAPNVAATSYVDSGVTNGTVYFYVVSAVNGSGEGANSAQVSGHPLSPPAAPSGLTATSGNAQVSLGWSASSTATGYNVKRSTVSGGPFTIIAPSLATASYVDSSVTNGTTYFYVVSAVNGSGEGANSAQVSSLPLAPPAAPSGVSASAGNAQVSLSWGASSTATSYNVKRSTVIGGPYTTTAANVATTSYLDSSVTNGTTYFYVVSAVNGSGEGANSAQVSGQPLGPPAPPTSVSATAGSAQVSLSWGASLTATGYSVKRSVVSGGPYTTIAPNVVTTGYVDSSVANGTTYYYVISAVNGSGEGANSAQVSGQPLAPPPAPSGLTATSGNAQVSLSWGPSSTATSYNVKRATVSGGSYTTIAPNVATTSYLDSGTTNGTTYYYVVSAVNGSGEGANSGQISGQPLASPAAPAGLTATPGNTQMSLNWGASSTATSYKVKRSTVSGGPYTTIAPTVAVTSYVDISVTNGTTYFYVVSAVNGSGEGANSAQVSGQALAPPAAPTGLTATSGNAQVSLTWGASSTATSYKVKRSAVSGGSYTIIAPNVATTSYVDSSLTNGATYYYVVSAVNGSGEGANSGQVAGQPLAPPAAPGGLTTSAGNAQVSLSWGASSTANSYNVRRSTVSGGPYTTVGVNVATTNYVNTGLTNGTIYFYVVSAVNNSGESANSNQVSGQPSASPGVSIWSPSAVPAETVQNSNPIELGLKFRTDINGFIKGVRFYKAASNSGPHIGSLWSSNRTLLGRATFTNETASGWQQVLFATPIPVTANATYIVSYFAPHGYYSRTMISFVNGADNPPLHVLANDPSGGNGVYLITPSSSFPNNSYGAANYWVDVIFSTSSQ